MARHMFFAILVLLLAFDRRACAVDAGSDIPIQAAIDALQQEPANAARFDALARVTSSSAATPEQARALAICYLGYHLSGKATHAKNVKAILDANHATSVYRNHVRDDRLFSQTICPDCKGSGTLETPCSKCSSGKCTNCGGKGTKPGISSLLTCSLCKGTGACTSCKGAGFLGSACQNCRGAGIFSVFKRDETEEIYRSLLQQPLDFASQEAANTPPILEESAILEFSEAYEAATSLNKHAVYQSFLRQIGCDDATPPPLLFVKVPDGVQFVVKDVSMGKDKGGEQHYYAILSAKGYSRSKLIIPVADKAFADSLEKDTVLTARGWVKPLKGLPPWGKSSGTFYRSADDYRSLQ